ncbi:MAG: A/G-specific adenine glycosylase [Pontimonas sp.]
MSWAPLRQWYRENHRDLPWRHPDTTPWAILVSEVMLQQTPVSRVIPAWTGWLARWPTADALATAPLGDVLQQWGRMGYPRRAKNLHRTAQIVSSEFGGELPRDINELLALPGIGDYTARAIACFAYNQPHPVVDTNVKRVIARVVDGVAAAGHWSIRQGLENVHQAMEADSDVDDYCLNQKALMELGALICTARSPQCELCPLASACRWRALDFPLDEKVLPRTQAKYEGSDRQVRGLILSLLRDSPGDHSAEEIAQLWHSPGQLTRALRSLIDDGLVVESERQGDAVYGLSWSEPYPGE